jgi:hypothetical protein
VSVAPASCAGCPEGALALASAGGMPAGQPPGRRRYIRVRFTISRRALRKELTEQPEVEDDRNCGGWGEG